MAKMTYEEIKAVGLKKGMRVRFQCTATGRFTEATVKKVNNKTAWEGSKMARNADGKKQYFLIAFTEVSDCEWDIIEEVFYSMEVIK